MNKACLGLGSNLGDRSANLAAAIRRLNDSPDIEVSQVSSVYETAPVGVLEQPDFLNLVAVIATSLTPHVLLDRCLAIEQALGRVRRPAQRDWGPRIIDLDLLTFGDAVIDDERLTLPHPRMAERAFVVIPLAEIEPQLRIAGISAGELAAGLDGADVKKIGPLKW